MSGVFQPNVFQHSVFQVNAFTGTITGTQASQSASLTAREDFRGVVTGTQASPSASLTAREDFRASVGATQATQTAAGTALERFIATLAASQAAQSGSVTADEAFRATIGAAQSGQSAVILAFTPYSFSATINTAQVAVEEGPGRHGAPLGAAIVRGPAQRVRRQTSRTILVAPEPLPAHAVLITATQRSQTASVAAAYNDDELAYALLEAA